MHSRNKKLPVLLAGDDEPELFLTRQALAQAGVHNEIISLPSLQEVTRYLRCVHEPGLSARFPVPGVLLLDLGLLSLAERELLRFLGRHPDWHETLPVVILSRSESAGLAEAFHAQETLLKPSEFPNLLRLVRDLKRRWFDHLTAQQPAQAASRTAKVQSK